MKKQCDRFLGGVVGDNPVVDCLEAGGLLIAAALALVLVALQLARWAGVL